jgi:hypothetical protein
VERDKTNALAAEIVARIYASEVSATLRWFWDGGFEWEIWSETISDPGSDGTAKTFPLAAMEMAEATAARYPDSPFAAWWKARK